MRTHELFYFISSYIFFSDLFKPYYTVIISLFAHYYLEKKKVGISFLTPSLILMLKSFIFLLYTRAKKKLKYLVSLSMLSNVFNKNTIVKVISRFCV